MAEDIELPAGMARCAELGDSVVGTSITGGARLLLWAKFAVWSAFVVVALVGVIQSFGLLFPMLLALFFAGACALLAANNFVLARMGDSPVLTVDAEYVHCHLPMNRVSVRLDAITRVDRIRRDLLIEARGGILRNGRPSRARWVAISQAHIFEVTRSDLIAYLQARVAASRPG